MKAGYLYCEDCYNKMLKKQKEAQRAAQMKLNKDAQKRIEKSKEGPVILFRGIPWGSSFEEVDSFFAQSSDMGGISGLRWKTKMPNSKTMSEFKYISTDLRVAEDRQPVLKSHDLGIVVSAEPCLKVAGVPVSKLILYFAYVPEDGEIIRDTKHLALYAAEYQFCFSQKFEVYTYENTHNDTDIQFFHPECRSEALDYEAEIKSTILSLRTKLSKLYGHFDKQDSAYHWYGKNDTEVQIIESVKTVHFENNLGTKYAEENSLITGEATISYLWHKGDKLLLAADRATTRAKTNMKNSLDGL